MIKGCPTRRRVFERDRLVLSARRRIRAAKRACRRPRPTCTARGIRRAFQQTFSALERELGQASAGTRSEPPLARRSHGSVPGDVPPRPVVMSGSPRRRRRYDTGRCRPLSAFVVGKEHHGHHDCDDDSQNCRDAHEDQQWRCCALTFLDHGFETLYLGDRMVYESTRLFPDLLQEEIRAMPVIGRCAHSHHARADGPKYTSVFVISPSSTTKNSVFRPRLSHEDLAVLTAG